ncbi:MAG: glycosyltransferase family 4 protein [Verrucomicrobiia bacterium]
MKILYDHQTFSVQEFGGISRYFYEVISRIKKYSGFSAELSLLFSNNHYLNESFKYHRFFPHHKFKGKVRIMTMINRYYSIHNLKNSDFDIFHPTYYEPYFLKYLNKKTFVLTVYDMIHEKYSNYFGRRDKTSEYKYLLCQKAKKIIAISNNTKKDLIEIFKIPDSKIDVVYLAGEIKIEKTGNIETNLSTNYILYVGNRGGYKNYEFFVKAISPLLVRNRELNILCAGGNNFSDKEKSLFDELNIRNQVLYFKVMSDNEIAQLYKNAICFVFPSLYEGFGIPILEAFSCGCPVLLSNTSSFPEVAGEAGLYFEPYDKISIRNAIEKIIADRDLRTALIKKGYERLKLFSWDITAEKTKKVYENVY